MPKKVVLIADPGIDTAFAVAFALHDPNLDVIGLLPCAGNVSAAQATANANILIEQFDPAKWPRTATALPVEYELDGTALHGADGFRRSSRSRSSVSRTRMRASSTRHRGQSGIGGAVHVRSMPESKASGRT